MTTGDLARRVSQQPQQDQDNEGPPPAVFAFHEVGRVPGLGLDFLCASQEAPFETALQSFVEWRLLTP
jgi:hypothetical protein